MGRELSQIGSYGVHSWQVAYVWAFLIKFRRDNIPVDAERFQKTNVITELKTVDE